jgi:hypothetical protein
MRIRHSHNDRGYVSLCPWRNDCKDEVRNAVSSLEEMNANDKRRK